LTFFIGNNFDGIDLPMDRFIKEKQHTSTDIMGFELVDEQIGESEFKAPLNKSKV
jgi:hypothetical protein